MSAGGISYSGLVNHGKVTLPSVDTWGSNMNILRDPPKSLFTRKIDKVGETSSITEEIDQSSNRSCEAIQVYARGVNPSVSVSYSNNGNNGGQRAGGITAGINSIQSVKLPYSAMRDGAFRPPVLRQEQLLPLSRLPRNITSAMTTPEFIDFSKKMKTCGTAEQTKEVKNSIIKTNVKPTATYKLEKSIEEPFELIKQSTQPVLKVSAKSGIKSMDITNLHVGTPTKEICNDNLHINAQSKLNMNKHVNNNHLETQRYLQDVYYKNVLSKQSTNLHDVPVQGLETDRYLQDVNHQNVGSKLSSNLHDGPIQELETDRYLQDVNHQNVGSKLSSNLHDGPIQDLETSRYLQAVNHQNVGSKKSTNLHHTSIESIVDLVDLPVHNKIIICEADAPYSGPEQTKYIHNDISLDRSLPEYNASTNLGDSKVYKRLESDNSIELERNIPKTYFENNHVEKGNLDHSSREARLADKIQPGGFNNYGSIPKVLRDDNGISDNIMSEKAKMNKLISENMLGRFGSAPPYK
jgi:hypothetical protein